MSNLLGVYHVIVHKEDIQEEHHKTKNQHSHSWVQTNVHFLMVGEWFMVGEWLKSNHHPH